MLRRATPERLSAFSDGVFAVLITVLVLELRPPELPTFEALLSLWHSWLSYAVSYVFIAIVWTNHHHLLRYATDATPRLVWFDFAHLFASWFNRGFLVLRRIDWTTPANILEKIIRYEAVHAINGWDDLRRRLEPPDRRLYAFFHPALGDEPLIFVEVALTDSIPSAIAPLLATDRR